MNDKRVNPPKPETELYQLSKTDIRNFIDKERRHDEIDRLRDVKAQKATWNRIFAACLLMNIIFIIFAFMGETIFGY